MLGMAVLLAASAADAQVMWRGPVIPGKTFGDPVYRQHGVFVYRLAREPGFVYARYALFSLAGNVRDRSSWKQFDELMVANVSEDARVRVRYAWQRIPAASYTGGAALLGSTPTPADFEVPVNPGDDYSPPPDPWPNPVPHGCGPWCPDGPGCNSGDATWGCIKCCYR
jgi:hypothetical protein